jgi:gamma-glutamylcyclotransferase (GGCT)/AIG2-like uncharacterized protein YtfP
MQDAGEQLYFAFGSNLDEADLEEWCRRRGEPFPLRRPIARAYVPDFEPVFGCRSRAREGGALDIRPRFAQAVPGALYEVEEGGWDVLDRKEGVPENYEQKRVTALSEDGRALQAWAYMAAEGKRESGHVPPAPGYAETVRRGLDAWGLPAHLLEAAARGERAPWLIDRVFVYGTLLRGKCNAGLLEFGANILSVREARIGGRLYDLGPFPGVLPGEGEGDAVAGEIYRLADMEASLRILDRLEGFQGYGRTDNVYRRSLVRAASEDGDRELAWVYIYLRTVRGPRIASGDWRAKDGE